MKLIRGFKFLLAALLISVLLCGQRLADTSGVPSLLQKPLGGLVAGSYNSAPQGFAASLLSAGVPGGSATSVSCQPTSQKAFGIKGSTLGDALRSIIKANPRYRWEIQDGVVNLLPVEMIPPLLDVRIDQFDSRDAIALTYAAEILFQSPEIRAAEGRLKINSSPNQIQIGLQAMPPPGLPRPPERPLAIRLRNITALDALNAIVRANGHGVWVYQERDCGKNNSFALHFDE